MSMETVYNTRGRPLMFTPERMDQVKNLVERGQTREQIASVIGCTPGTLTVMCSRLGISLRRPKLDNGVRVTSRPARATTPDEGNGKNHDAPLQRPPQPQEQFVEPQPPDADAPIAVTIRMEYRGQARETQLQLPADAVTRLILEAEMRNLRLTELLARIIVACVDNDFLQHLK
jgi:Helix-turn-helix domain of resolvase